jgi:hypothetical protein
MTNTTRTVATCAAALLVGACGDSDGPARASTVEYDTIGDTIVARVQGPPAWGNAVTVQEEVRIGELDGADEYTLGNVVSITVDEAGSIHVLDGQALTVRKYDAHGRHVQSIGRSGEGPGELRQPHSLEFLPDGRLAVRDFRNARINLYDSAGDPVGTVPIPAGFFTSTPMQVDSAGRIYTSVITDRPEGQMFRAGYVSLAVDGTVHDTIRNPREDFQFAPPLIARNTTAGGTSMSATSVPFAPGVSWTIDRGGNVVWGIGDEYVIHTVRDGRPLRIVRMDATPVPVSAAEKSAAQERVLRNMRQTQPNWSWSGPGIPDTKPFFGSITVAHDGRLWVQLSQPAVREPADTTVARPPGAPAPLDRWIEPLVYDVFESDGRYLARVALPANFRAMFMRGDHIWGVQRDEYDVNYVVRLRILS